MDKPTKAQQELLHALEAGVRVLRSSDYPKHWMRNDTYKKCTKLAQAILDGGFATVSRADPPVRFYEHELRLTAATQPMEPPHA